MAQPTSDESELTFLTTLSKTQSLPITVNQRSFRVAHRAVKPTKKRLFQGFFGGSRFYSLMSFSRFQLPVRVQEALEPRSLRVRPEHKASTSACEASASRAAASAFR